MLRLSRSNPRKKYEIDIKCDCEDPEKSWRVHEGHDFEASSQFQAADREQTEPTKPHWFAKPVFYRLCSARDHHDQIPAGHPDIEKVHDQSASARPMSRVRPITGTSTRDKFPMEGRQNLSSEGGSSTLRRADQVFSLKAYSTAAESSGTARITRKTGARTAVIWGTTRIARSGRGRSSMESADSTLRQNDAIVRS